MEIEKKKQNRNGKVALASLHALHERAVPPPCLVVCQSEGAYHYFGRIGRLDQFSCKGNSTINQGFNVRSAY